MAELVEHRVSGLHVPPGDAAALAETMAEASDPGLWTRLSGPAVPVEHAAFVDAHVHMYESLLEAVPA
jgi:hypothetical protein